MDIEGSDSSVFETTHYAAGVLNKLKRSLELGPKYYLWDVPNYYVSRKRLKLPLWDPGVLFNPLREFRRNTYHRFPSPPHYEDALRRLAEIGVRMTMPRGRLEALVAAWWQTHQVRGDVIECGAFRGATSLLLALLGAVHRVPQTTLMLDTFRGMPDPSSFDPSRRRGEFVPMENQADKIREQAAALGISDRVEIHQGLFHDTFAKLQPRGLQFSFAHVDANIYQSTWEACEYAVPRVSSGGIVVFDDYNGVCDLGARLAIDKHLATRRLRPIPLAGSSAFIRIE